VTSTPANFPDFEDGRFPPSQTETFHLNLFYCACGMRALRFKLRFQKSDTNLASQHEEVLM